MSSFPISFSAVGSESRSIVSGAYAVAVFPKVFMSNFQSYGDVLAACSFSFRDWFSSFFFSLAYKFYTLSGVNLNVFMDYLSVFWFLFPPLAFISYNNLIISCMSVSRAIFSAFSPAQPVCVCSVLGILGSFNGSYPVLNKNIGSFFAPQTEISLIVTCFFIALVTFTSSVTRTSSFHV